MRLHTLFVALVFTLPLLAGEDASLRLAPHIDAWLNILKGKTPAFTVSAESKIPGSNDEIKVRFGGLGLAEFYFLLDGPRDVKGVLLVSPERIFIDLPAKNIAIVSEGDVKDENNRLKPRRVLDALIRLQPAVEKLWPLIESADGVTLAGAFNPLLNAEHSSADDFPETHRPKSEKKDWEFVKLQPRGAATDILIAMNSHQSRAYRVHAESKKKAADNTPSKPWVLDIHITEQCQLPTLPEGRKTIRVAREELERSLMRGALRAIDLQFDDLYATDLPEETTEIPGARMVTTDGQRTAWLTGSPREMGVQHGKLLAKEARRVTDSTLYVVGLAYTVAKGEWFLDTIRDAWRRLEPHTDAEYLEELQGLAEGSGIPYDELKLANVFPELFHCSGFALSGDATVGGKLLHGRVLDYMTNVGFQHVQCDFITHKPGKKATVNIGYAGFIGCVSGMNDAQISMGEMGGRGEGNWDGTPMAFLMRRALENAGTLDDARKIMADAKRTCEYYYIIADGKSRTASGVAAWPEKIEFIAQNQAHTQLPNAFPGCVLLSVGDRYQKLSERVKAGHGKLDEAGAIELMSRPVAMNGNLHNALFVPEDQVYWTAHASRKGREPAATQEYAKHDFKAKVNVLKTLAEKK